jgi:hypothetical protein
MEIKLPIPRYRGPTFHDRKAERVRLREMAARASEGMMDERTKRVAMAICAREASYQANGSECKACREAHYGVGDVYLPNVPDGCKGLGYEYLAEVAIKAADGT